MNIIKICLTFLLITASANAAPAQDTKKPQPPITAIVFTPPDGWRMAERETSDGKILPESVKTMVVGTGSSNFPPHLVLGTEKFNGTVADYLKKIKEINKAKGLDWKSLGTLKTDAGTASLSQVDTKSEWGDIRRMHVILKKDDTIYILTGVALKDEYPKFYGDFFKAFRSLRFDTQPLENQ